MSNKLRLRFSKSGRAVYISHLDLMHTMQRAFSRAGLHLKYSEGFNPHPQLSVAMPLSVGTSSECEILDFTLVDDKVAPDQISALLNENLPEGITVSSVYAPERKVAEIKWLRVHGVFEYDVIPAEKASDELSLFFSSESIVMMKKTKRGTAPLDVVPLIQSISFRPEDSSVKVEAVLSANEPVLNPDSLVEAVRQLKPDIAPDFSSFVRMEIMDSNNNLFE